MIHLKSEKILGVDYFNNGTLDVFFKNGHLLRFYDVPEFIFTKLLKSKSRAQYFENEIQTQFDYIMIH